MSWILELWASLDYLVDFAWRQIKEELDPSRIAIALYLLARLLGKTVQTGQWGVRFRFGRVQAALEPGFHWQFPGLLTIRVVPARSQSLDLKEQRISTPKGLVFLLDANLVYRVDDPLKALVQIDDYDAGCLTALALSVHEVIWAHGDSGLRDTALLSEELTRLLAPRLAPWGIVIEEAGFTTLAPSARTLRLTQLATRLGERRAIYSQLQEDGVSAYLAQGLLGSTRQLKERSSARYRKARLRHPRRPPSPRKRELARVAAETIRERRSSREQEIARVRDKTVRERRNASYAAYPSHRSVLRQQPQSRRTDEASR